MFQGPRRIFGQGSGAAFLLDGSRNVPPEIPFDTLIRMRDRERRFLTAFEQALAGL